MSNDSQPSVNSKMNEESSSKRLLAPLVSKVTLLKSVFSSYSNGNVTHELHGTRGLFLETLPFRVVSLLKQECDMSFGLYRFDTTD